MCKTGGTEKTQAAIKAAMNKDKMMAAIPKECFEKSMFWSTYWMLFDYTVWLGSTYLMWLLQTSGEYAKLPEWQQYAATGTFWAVAGFFMWGVFVVGHDCGHTTFSSYTVLNDFIGHVTHGSILVPYWPWRRSHNFHHQFHNHIDKDYSHPWYTEDRMKGEGYEMARMMDNYPAARLLFPFVGWPVYLYGMPDGSHWIPDQTQRLWEKATFGEMLKCYVSTAVVIAYAVAIFELNGRDIGSMAYYYLAPLSVFGWWLVCVTYLQHHDHDTLVYDDDNWKFTDAAFETVDRQFSPGGVIDKLMHNITNGHVVHHLFFTKIPHYNLSKATAALRGYLEERGAGKCYKFKETYDFGWRLHKYMYQFGFMATEAPKKKN